MPRACLACLSSEAMEGAKPVFDAGSVIWALEYAYHYPESEAPGADPILFQLSLVSPNCSFEMGDFDEEVDLIVAGIIAECVKDTTLLTGLRKPRAGRRLSRDGKIVPNPLHIGRRDPEPDRPDPPRRRQMPLQVTLAPEYKSYTEGARSSMLWVERGFKWPIEEWPRDPHNKQFGVSVRESPHTGIEGMLTALFLAVPPRRCWCLPRRLGGCLKDPRVHADTPIGVAYDRKASVS